MIGKKIAHYSVSEKIGQGGMGVVYKARDTHLDRNVAIKVLPAEAVANVDRKRRFVQEAKAASALNHPNIITIYDIDHSDGVDFIAMEYVEGHTLHKLIGGSGLVVEQALNYAVQITSALATAHTAGIVHRDLKPSNIMVTENGVVKVLDFGLAKLTEGVKGSESSTTQTMSPVTEEGTIVGTVAYVSPEQAEGKEVDARSDVFSFGAVFYEMLSGRRAFQGESYISTLSAILRETPTPVRKLRADVPVAVERIVNHCLEKNREARYASAAEIWKDLAALQSQLAARRVGFGQILRRPRFAIPALIVLAALAVAIGWFWMRSSRIRWARTVALPEITRLGFDQRGCAALRLLEQAEKYLQGDPEFERLRQNATFKSSIRTDPPGADFFIRDYGDVADNAEWMHLGRTPLESVVIPVGLIAYRITKPDFDDVEGAAGLGATFEKKLSAKGISPPGMIWVPAWPAGGSWTLIQTVVIRDVGIEGFWLDKYEVTNKQFKEFVDRRGYEKKEYWKHRFVNEGKGVSWEEAMARFRDTTGRPGPATWEYGTYPQGQDDYPVSGVSWYEAAAYAEFSGKSLPTIHHWASACGYMGGTMPILQVSNFSRKGPAPVGSYKGLGLWGSYDMAGNVREWCLNASGDNRYILGGAWNDTSYMFYMPNLRPPMDRSSVNGFRCAIYTSPPSEEVTGAVQFIYGDRRGDKPVSDAIFQIYKSIHEYDHGDLRPKIEASDDKLPFWRLEEVSYQAAYGNERITGLLYLPKNATPPYQTVVYFPGLAAVSARVRTSQNLQSSFYDFIIRSGRAVLCPIYKGTYERSVEGAVEGRFKHNRVWREISIDAAKDLGRSLDYLETRRDIDREKLAYQGLSWGACEGPRLLAIEPRLKAGVLLSGGAYEREWSAEIDPFNFAPHTRTPILMLNGKHDVLFQLEPSQIPLFQILGTPEKDKRHVVVEGGHAVLNEEIIREALAWLDRYLGPVRTR